MDYLHAETHTKRDPSSKSYKANRGNSMLKCRTTSPRHENKQVSAPEKRIRGALYRLLSPHRSPPCKLAQRWSWGARLAWSPPRGFCTYRSSGPVLWAPRMGKTYIFPSSLGDSNSHWDLITLGWNDFPDATPVRGMSGVWEALFGRSGSDQQVCPVIGPTWAFETF